MGSVKTVCWIRECSLCTAINILYLFGFWSDMGPLANILPPKTARIYFAAVDLAFFRRPYLIPCLGMVSVVDHFLISRRLHLV